MHIKTDQARLSRLSTHEMTSNNELAVPDAMKNPTIVQTSPYVIIIEDKQSMQVFVMDIAAELKHPVADVVAQVLVTCQKPTPLSRLTQHYSSELLDSMLHSKWLSPVEERWDLHSLRRVEIETSTVCNWRCEYCPVKHTPKPAQSMSMDLFLTIIEKAARHPTVEAVTFHSYCEPTLDRHFEERVEALSKTRLKLDLFTNGSGLIEKKLWMLKNSGVVRRICFNFPTLDEARFKEMTGSSSYKQTLEHIDLAISYGFDVKFAVMDKGDEQSKENLREMNQRFAALLQSRIEPWRTTDRAGLLTNDYFKDLHITDPYLFGCFIAAVQLHISVSGECFLCCEDYHQKETFGNIASGEIVDIVNSPRAKLLRKRVFGGVQAPDDFICRRCLEMNKMRACAKGVAHYPLGRIASKISN